tara:strand:- start:8595 stop:8918 length:324 start_codon:yes stop_codon:yes gene_type:complete
MSTVNLSDVSKLPAFKELVRQRQKLRFTMIGLMMLVFISYLILWAYFPALANVRIPADSPVTLNIWFTALVVVVAIGLSAYYSMVGSKKLDEYNKKLIQDINDETHQ